MNIALWIAAGILAAACLVAGLGKLARPKSDLAKNANMAWTQDFSQGAIRGIGTAEILGAIGLILPQATRIAPILTPIAAPAWSRSRPARSSRTSAARRARYSR